MERFDRQGARRIPFLSAMSMLGAADRETHSYLEMVDALRQYGASPKEDATRTLAARLVQCADLEHGRSPRNYGFLYDSEQRGWRLPQPMTSTRFHRT